MDPGYINPFSNSNEAPTIASSGVFEGLTPFTNYHFYGYAEDTSGNVSVVSTTNHAVAQTTDVNPPTIGTVTLSLGDDPSSELLLVGLDTDVNDDSGLASITVIYNIIEDHEVSSGAVQTDVPIGVNEYTLQVPEEGTQYFV
jgi:hypothetical protein